MRKLLILTILFTSSQLLAQKLSHYEKFKAVLEKGSISIDPLYFVGTWQTTDSSISEIEFFWNGSVLSLGKDQWNSYKFIKFDALAMPSILGGIARWPPLDCIVDVVDSNTIAIVFLSVYNNNDKKYIYKRVKQ